MVTLTDFAHRVAHYAVRAHVEYAQHVHERYLHRRNGHEGRDHIIEGRVRRLGENVQQVHAVRPQRRRRAVHAGCERGQLH